jgi:intein/homing endonuclease
MRIFLKKGSQKILIELAKKGKTWNDLSKTLNLNPCYLCNSLKLEKTSISEETYKKLCIQTNKNFDKFIVAKKEDSWGQSLGARNSPGSTIKIKSPKESQILAEIVGAILGDGNIMFYKKGKKVGVYQISITGHKILDKQYHVNYLAKKFKSLFNVEPKQMEFPRKNARRLVIYSRDLVSFFAKMGLKPGDKMKNQTTIPPWIFKKKKYLQACLRGLIDTDGCIHRMSQRDSNLIRINFVNHNQALLRDTHRAFYILDYRPSKIIRNRIFYISRQNEIGKYLKEIGFSNKKHIDRLKKFKKAL